MGIFRAQEGDAAARSADASRLRDVVSRCNALGTERLRAVFSTRNLEQDLGRLLRSGNVEQHRDVLERPLAAAALAGVLECLCRACMRISVFKLRQLLVVTCLSHALRRRQVPRDMHQHHAKASCCN